MKPIKVVADSKYPNMYRLQWEDGVLSADMYNLPRANDILRHYDGYRERMRMAAGEARRRSLVKKLKVPATPVAADMENA